jgi:hypothetical protein
MQQQIGLEGPVGIAFAGPHVGLDAQGVEAGPALIKPSPPKVITKEIRHWPELLM